MASAHVALGISPNLSGKGHEGYGKQPSASPRNDITFPRNTTFLRHHPQNLPTFSEPVLVALGENGGHFPHVHHS